MTADHSGDDRLEEPSGLRVVGYGSRLLLRRIWRTFTGAH